MNGKELTQEEVEAALLHAIRDAATNCESAETAEVAALLAETARSLARALASLRTSRRD